MTAVLLIIHVLIAAALTGVILMQRSEGGALGIGGGPGGMMSGRGAANLLTRITMILGALFIGNSILLAILSGVTTSTGSVLDRVGQSETSSDLPFGDLQGLDADAIDAPEATIPAEPAPADDAPTEDEPSAELPNR
ncbi:Protein-export membrane protein SecG [Oceanicaulis sp. 350]|nr:Protein-export membrane protein SecG [Oceanicaulis sp. 350]